MNYYSQRSISDRYFQDRLDAPYRSTLALNSFLAKRHFFDSLLPGMTVADLACGTGSEAAWLATRYPHLEFIGNDLEPSFVAAARSRYAGIGNLRFFTGDVYHLHECSVWDSVQAVWLSQTLSWLPWWTDALASLDCPNVDRIGISTLAWDSPWESEVIHYSQGRDNPLSECVNYNVYSIPLIQSFMDDHGFPIIQTERFHIDIDLEPPSDKGLGSYTIEMFDRERMTFSLWQHLPWVFFYFSRQQL